MVWPVTNHDFLAFLAGARDFFGLWPDEIQLYFNLRENTPKAQTRWDQQARAVISRMLKRGLIEWVGCPGPALGFEPCEGRHLALTVLGQAQLSTWNRLGCGTHTHSANCHARKRRFKLSESKGGRSKVQRAQKRK